MSGQYFDDLNEVSEELYQLAICRTLSDDAYNWWEALETVGFYRVWLGKTGSDDDLLQSGRKLLASMANGHVPARYLRAMPTELRTQIRNEYAKNGITL